jgi:hypothetical protein
MRFDFENMWSGEGPQTVGGAITGEAVTVDADSGNDIDHGAAGPGPRVMDGRAYVQVVVAFNTLTSLQAFLESDDNTSPFGAATILAAGPIVALADLVPGAVLLDVGGVRLVERYTHIRYDVVGTPATLGQVVAGIVDGVQDGYGQR